MALLYHRRPARTGRPDHPNAVARQHVDTQEGEQEHALEHAGDGAGQVHFYLRRLAADVGERHDEPGQQDADGVQSSQEGDDVCGEGS